jgi:hypothetical protein
VPPTDGHVTAAEAITHLTRLMARLSAEPPARPPSDAEAATGATRTAPAVVEGPELLVALGLLRQVRSQLTGWEPQLIGAARGLGITWTDIAPALGLASRQAAERRYLRLNPQPDDLPATTGEQRGQAVRSQRAGNRAVIGSARDSAAALRQLAEQVSALNDRRSLSNLSDPDGLGGDPGLAPSARAHVARVQRALGANDAADLLEPLSAAEASLRASHPALADQIADLTQAADQARSVERADRSEPPMAERHATR